MTVKVKVLSAVLALGLLAVPAGAEENEITDALDCDQGSDEFYEGCDAYVEEVGDAMPDDEEAEEG